MKKSKLKFKSFLYLILVFIFVILGFNFPIHAQTTSPTKVPTITLTIKPGKITPSPTATPTSAEDEKVQEIRDAIKQKVSEIEDKIEKKAYVGVVTQITDSTLTVENFRGKQRVRLTEDTTIIGSNKKGIKQSELAVDDNVITMGTVSDNEILEAARVLVVAKPQTTLAKRLIIFGKIIEINSKNSSITVSSTKNLDLTLEIKIDQSTFFSSLIDTKVTPKFKDLVQDQKIIVIYPETAAGKTPLAKTIFLLP